MIVDDVVKLNVTGDDETLPAIPDMENFVTQQVHGMVMSAAMVSIEVSTEMWASAAAALHPMLKP